MYSYMLQTAEERLRKRRVKASREEVAPSLSALAMDIDDSPPAIPSLTSTSSPGTTTPPSRPSSPPFTVAFDDIPEDPSFSSLPQNLSLLITSTILARDGVAVVIVDALPLFPISIETSSPIFPMASSDAYSFPISSSNLETPSTSSIPLPFLLSPLKRIYSLRTNSLLHPLFLLRKR